MNKIKSLLLATFFFLLGRTGNCSPNDSLVIRLSIQTKEISRREDLTVSLTIKSLQEHLVLLPDEDSWGLISSHIAFYLIEIQKKSDDNYTDMEIRGHLDNLPNLNTDTLRYNQQRELSFPIRMLDHYTKGEYRMRVLCKLSSLNNLQDKYSNWIYFTCKNDIEGTY